MVQKGIGLHVQHHAIALSAHGQLADFPDWMPGLALRSTKGTEIVFADQDLAGGVHPFHIERSVAPCRSLPPQRRPMWSIENEIAIAAGQRRKSGVKLLRHLAGPAHAEIEREIGIATQHPRSHRAHGRRIEMHHLTDSMHSAIGSTSANRADRMIRHLGQRSFQAGLHGSHPRTLGLPAPKSRPIVLNAQRDAHPLQQSAMACRNKNPPANVGGWSAFDQWELRTLAAWATGLLIQCPSHRFIAAVNVVPEVHQTLFVYPNRPVQ